MLQAAHYILLLQAAPTVTAVELSALIISLHGYGIEEI